MQSAKTYYLFLTLLATVPAAASSITGLSLNNDHLPYTLSLEGSFTSSAAMIIGSFSCNLASTCAGEIGTFSIDANIVDVPSTPVLRLIMVNVSGESFSEGIVGSVTGNIASPPQLAGPYGVGCAPAGCSGASNSMLPPLGEVVVEGTMDLTLAAHHSLDLELIFQVTPMQSAEPEPNTALLTAPMVAGLFLIRGARKRFA